MDNYKKKYKKALERATRRWESGLMTREELEEIFPELKENKDEQIRKGLINGFEFYSEQEYWGTEKFPLKITDILAWLEKQKSVEWSQDDLICLGYLADFVDKNGDDFYGKNKPNVVKWVRSFAELPTHEHINDIEQKPEWSEEDEKILKKTIDTIWAYANIPHCGINFEAAKELECWLKSIRPLQKQEWSEEDEEKQKAIIGILDYQASKVEDRICATDGFLLDDLISWLKSLRHQDRWKPSDEQMEALTHLIRSWGESGTLSPYGNTLAYLTSLLKDLKQLKAMGGE